MSTARLKFELIDCPACGNSDFQFLFEARDEFYGIPGNFRVVLCTNCDLALLNPRPVLEDLGRFYPEDYYSFTPPSGLPSVASGDQACQKAFLRRLGYPVTEAKQSGSFASRLMNVMRPEKFRVDFKPVPPFKSGGRILDVGCGAGYYLSEMKKLGWETDGVEFSKQACDAALQHYGIPVVCGGIEDAKLEENSLDVITFFETLEHVPEPRRAAAEAYRALKPGGLLLMTVPNRESFYAGIFGAAYFPLEIPRHLYHFSKDSMESLLAHAGFRDVRITTFTPGASAVILSMGIWWRRMTGKHGLPPDFWKNKTLLLRLSTWLLKPLNFLLDRSGRGVHLEIRAVKS